VGAFLANPCNPPVLVREKRMKAVEFAQYGDPRAVAKVVEVDQPVPGPQEVLIAVEASPFRFADIYMMRGDRGFRSPLPAIPGGTGIGRVAARGADVMTLDVGDRVYLPRTGTWREYMTAPADILFKGPKSGDAVDLAQVNSNGITAHSLLRHGGNLNPGDWVIQSAANSNCGRYVIQLARRWGFRTVNIVRNLGHAAELKSLGADVVVRDGADFSAKVKSATNNAEISVGFDMVGGETTGRMAQCLANRGTIAQYGQVSRAPAQVPINLMLFKHLTLYGFLAESALRDSGATRDGFAAVYDELAGLVTQGELKSHIGAVYSLDDVGAAIDAVTLGAAGKVVITP